MEKLVVEAQFVFTAGDVYGADNLWAFPITLLINLELENIALHHHVCSENNAKK